MTFRFGFVSVVIAFGSLFATSAPAPAQYGATDGEWRSYGGDNGSTKYSPLDQIDAGNFSSLEIAWRAPTPDARLDFDAIAREQERRGRVGEAPPGGNADYGLSLRLFKATPLMVDGLLFVSTPLSQAAAFDAGCFRHQVLLRCDRHVHDRSSGPPSPVSEHPHVAQPRDKAPPGHEDVPQGQPPRGQARLHRGRPDLAPKLQRPMRANEVVVTA